ncbi:MAG: hypothetical protein ACREBW_02060 [Candidatus Micrarchaeaceae archaeon]
MGVLDWIFGFRWSLIVMHGQDNLYVLNENNAMCLAGFIMGFYGDGGEPVPPWSLHLCCNKFRRSFELRPEHFAADGRRATDLFTQQLEAIDPNWRVPHGDPIFIEVATKRRIPLSNAPTLSDPKSFERMFTTPKHQQTFYSVMRDVFGEVCA